MHEKHVIDDVVKKIEDLAREQNATKVVKISVKLGALSHMSAEHFKEHFDMATVGSIAQDAEIEAEESQDIHDPHATGVVLKSIDVAD